MLSYIAGDTKPDIAYALNVLARYCNNQGRRHIVFLNHLVKYREYSNDDRLKFYAHRCPYDAVTMKRLTQARFQCDADLAGNLDNLHSTSARIGYIGTNGVVSFTAKLRGACPCQLVKRRNSCNERYANFDGIPTKCNYH